MTERIQPVQEEKAVSETPQSDAAEAHQRYEEINEQVIAELAQTGGFSSESIQASLEAYLEYIQTLAGTHKSSPKRRSLLSLR